MGSVGFEGSLTVASQTIGKAQDVTLASNRSEVETTTQGSASWKEFLAGLGEWTVEVPELWVPTDTGVQTIRDAFLNRTLVTVSVKDKNGYGFSGSGYVVRMENAHPLDGAVGLNCTIRGTGALATVTGS